jgi:hypothetical protein
LPYSQFRLAICLPLHQADDPLARLVHLSHELVLSLTPNGMPPHQATVLEEGWRNTPRYTSQRNTIRTNSRISISRKCSSANTGMLFRNRRTHRLHWSGRHEAGYQITSRKDRLAVRTDDGEPSSR